MRLQRRLLFSAAYILVWLHLAAAQQPQFAQPAAQQKQPQSVSGRVVNALDQHPLAHASVSLQELKEGQNAASTFTDSEGRYRFDRVPPGKYTLMGQASGYQPATYLDHEQYGTAIVTGAGLETDALVLQLTPLARIFGHILDDAGEPIDNGSVELYRTRASALPESAEQPTRFRAVQTTDSGEYEFDRLPPGRYFLSAHGTPWYAVYPQLDQPNAAYAYSLNVDPQLNVAYPTVFYPHALDSAEATPLVIKGGEQITANLEMQPQPAVSLRLTLPPGDLQNRGFPQLTHTVFGVEEPVPAGSFSVLDDQGVLFGLTPGQYHVQLLSPAAGHLSVSAGEVRLSEASGSLDLSKPSELTTLTLRVQDGDEKGLPKGLQVIMRNQNGNQRPGNSSVDEKGSATLDNLAPGDYRLQFYGPGRQVNLLSLSVNGKPAPDRVLHIAESGSLSAEVTLSTFTATIEGFALRDGKPDAASMVALIPAGADTSEELFRRDQSDLDGSFTLANVIPGNYLLVAIDNGWPLQWPNLAALGPYLLHALPLEVSPTGPRQIKLAKPLGPQVR